MRILILGLISGFLSYLSVSLPHFLEAQVAVSDDLFIFFPGLLFAIFILVPLVKSDKYRIWRWLGLLLISIVAWFAAVSTGFQILPLVKQTPVLACGLSGSIGVLVVIAGSRFLVPWRFVRSSILFAILLGFLGGALIGMAIRQPRASLYSEIFYFLGFLFWHSSVAWSLFAKPFIVAEENSTEQTA